jgi:hypothetical protein
MNGSKFDACADQKDAGQQESGNNGDWSDESEKEIYEARRS